MNVPLFDLTTQWTEIRDEVMPEVEALFASQKFILGPPVEQLESDLQAHCEAPHAIACASGSDALVLALMALGVGAGDEVITTPFTFFATAGAIIRVGARPVFVDIEPDTFNIDPGLIEAAVTANTKAVIPVHLFGQCADMDVVNAIAQKHGLGVIEDAAQAIGARYNGTQAGSLGTVAAFSFFPTKNLGGFGDGGFLTTRDAELARRLASLRVHGMFPGERYHHAMVGMNSRLDALQAVVLRVKLRRLDEWNAARRANAAAYDAALAPLGVRVPPVADGRRHVYHQYVVRVDDRDALRDYLADQGVGSAVYYPIPLHMQPCFQSLGYKEGDFPVGERACREVLALPIFPELTADQREHVIETIRRRYVGRPAGVHHVGPRPSMA